VIRRIAIVMSTACAAVLLATGAAAAARAGAAPAGTRVTVRPDGTWRVEVTDPAAADMAAQWDASVCAGNFHGPVEVASRLEWGAEQTCTGNYAPQYIRVRLQSTCPDWWCVRFVDETGYVRSPYSEDYTRVSRIFDTAGCDSQARRKYRMTAFAYVRGIEFGPFISDEVVRSCDISA
jgi:hypothetical protein